MFERQLAPVSAGLLQIDVAVLKIARDLHSSGVAAGRPGRCREKKSRCELRTRRSVAGDRDRPCRPEAARASQTAFGSELLLAKKIGRHLSDSVPCASGAADED
jgi:hypothetical protein